MILTRFNFKLSDKMVTTRSPILKLSPTWLKQVQQEQHVGDADNHQQQPNGFATSTGKTFSLDLQMSTPASTTKEKVTVMYVSFVLHGNYLLCVQKRTVDLRKSIFQVVIRSTKSIQDEINNYEGEVDPFTVSLRKYEKVFDVNFSSICHVEFHGPDVLTIVGMKNGENYIVRQYRVKVSKHDIFLKNEFYLSLTTKQLIIKGKKSMDVLKNLKVPDVSRFVMTSLYCENHVTCFVYTINTFNCETRWLVCVYDSKAARTEEKFKYIEVRENLIRGRITGVSLLNNQSRIMLVTDSFQLLTYEVEKKKLVLKHIRLMNNDPVLFESDMEFIFTQKVTSSWCNSSSRHNNKDGSQQEMLLACSKSGKLFFIPDSYNPAYTSIYSVDISKNILPETEEKNFYIEQFQVCSFTKQCTLLCRNGMIYTYNLQQNRITQMFSAHNNNTLDYFDLPAFYYNLISLNFYGDELYYLKDNVVDVYLSQETECSTLKDMCRKTLLQNFPTRYVKNSKIPSKLKRFVLNGET